LIFNITRHKSTRFILAETEYNIEGGDFMATTSDLQRKGLDDYNKLFNHLTPEQQVELDEAKVIGNNLIHGINRALKMAYGKTPRPKHNLRESMLELQNEIDTEETVDE
jgi:hypothetical protein